MSSETLPRRLPGWLLLMGILTAIGPVSIDMYLPAFPAIAADLGVGRGEVERTLAVYLAGISVAPLVYGPLADRFGRRIPVLCGLALYCAAALGCALATDIETLTAGRLLQALGGAVGMVVPRAVIRDHYATQDAARALSMVMLVMGLAPMLAPIIGGQLLLVASWRANFWLMELFGLALLVATALTMRESLPPERKISLHPGIIARNYFGLLGHRGFVAHSLAGGLGQAGMFTYIVGSPRVFIEVFGVPAQYYGLLFGSNAAALIAGSQVSARLLRRHPSLVLQGRALVALALSGLVALALASSGVMTLWLLMACLLCYMASQGFVNPNSAALALSDQSHRLGAASAMMGTLQYLCGSLAGLAVSLWQTQSPLPLVTVMACCACLSWLSGRVARGGPAIQPAT
jgi:DHA1 family bicyclomycin/chloramphenicol resistance-like MFS transporter